MPTRINLNRSVPFVAAVFRFIKGHDTAQTAADILRKAEDRHGLIFMPLEYAYPATEKEPDEDEFSVASLQPFLAETHFVLAGGDCQSLLRLYDTQGYERSYSWREWGGEIADFANLHLPCAETMRDWNYLDFYSGVEYTQSLIEDYALWRDAIYRVVRLKVEWFGLPFSTCNGEPLPE